MVTEEQIRYDIMIEAKVANATLKELLKNTTDNNAKMLQFSELVVRSANQWKVSWQQALAVYKQINAEIAKSKKGGTLFGNVGGQDLFKGTQNYIQGIQDSGRAVAGLKLETTGMVSEVAKIAPTSDKAAGAIKKIEPATNSATRGLWSLRNMARTALGTLEAMVIFLIARFVGETLGKVISSVNQLEQAFFKLSIAEKSISGAGVDISPKQLQAIADEVVNTYETVSKIDALKMISNLAVLTKDLKLSSVEYAKLAKAIPLVAQQAGVSIDSATDQVITGLTKSGRGWADLGITVDAAIIRQAAVTDGLVASAEAYDALTAEQKQQVEVQALINILQKNTVENLGEQDTYLMTIQGSATKVGVAWENLMTTLGEISRPSIIQGLQVISVWLVDINESLIRNREEWGRWSGSVSAAFAFLGGMATGKGFKQSIQDAYDAMQEAKKLSESLGQLPEDTPTGKPAEVGGELNTDLADALEKMNNEILEANIKLEQDLQDVTIDLERKRQDILIEYARKPADIEKDYADKVIDINRDYAEKERDLKNKQDEANQKARNDELEREREFQNKLQEMKENFLMDLEDALHARDARQILKLIKQYELDKLQAERKYNLDKDNYARDEKLRQKSMAKERADLEREKKQKLRDAQEDYQNKIAKLQADQLAEEDAARLAALRKIEDLNKNNADRLAVIAANLVQEYNLTQEGLNAILTLYQKYYTDISAIYSAMQSMLAGMVGGQSTQPSYTASGITSGHEQGAIGGGYAEGGSVIANRPTKAIFGEGGLEMATFTPIGRNGRDINKMFSNLSGSGNGAGGQVSIELLLSPDLESRIVKNTLNKTGEIITRIGRSKN